MTVVELDIPGVFPITPVKHGTDQGFFSETYNRRALAEHGIDIEFVQDNHHLLAGGAGTLRGLHFQTPPYAQDKLVRVLRGAIYDVAVDLRRGSQYFGEHVSVELSAESWTQILIPQGFAHGFCTLAADTEVVYKVSDYHAPDHDAGLAWNDPDLAIRWPVSESDVILSEKDKELPRLADWEHYF